MGAAALSRRLGFIGCAICPEICTPVEMMEID